MESNHIDTQTNEIFARLKKAEVEAPPFLKARVMARLDDGRHSTKEIWIWRLIAGLGVSVACAAIVWTRLAPMAGSAPQAQVYAMKPYVIHVDLGGERLSGARIAEVELPDGVRFVSKAHPEVAKLRKMRLEVPEAIEGRSRLPFVVSSDRPGSAQVKLRILGENDQIIHERVLSVKFAAGQNTGMM